MTSFKLQWSRHPDGMFSTLITLILISRAGVASAAPVKPLLPVETVSARVVRDVQCIVEDEFYQDYIVGLGKAVSDLLKDYEAHRGANESRLPRLQTMSPVTVVSLNDSRGAVEQLWTTTCEVDSFSPWLEHAHTLEPDFSDDLLSLQRLANASVSGLRRYLTDFHSCDVQPLSTAPTVASDPPTGTTSPDSETAGVTSPELTTRQTVDMSLPCAVQLELLRPQSESFRLPAILDGMLVAIARLDAIVKRDFS